MSLLRLGVKVGKKAWKELKWICILSYGAVVILLFLLVGPESKDEEESY